VCCTVLRVDELSKPAGSDCRHQRAELGCGIHATRPGVCRGYHCLWLQGGLEAEERPDRTGGIVDLEPDGIGVRLGIREIRPGAFEASPALQAIADRYRGQMSVRIIHHGDPDDPDRPFRVLQADGLEHRVHGEWVEVMRHGERLKSHRLPWAERLGRRWSIWLRRLRGSRALGPRDGGVRS
jgi:Fe-S-cluster containining protein